MIRLFAMTIVTITLIMGGPVGAAEMMEKKEGKTLYERLGGVYPIAVVVDTFIDLLLVNDVLNANPKIAEARQRVPEEGLKYRVTELMCEVTGGPCTYTGLGMKESHDYLDITESEWDAMMSDFIRVLNNYGIPEQEQKELIIIMENTKMDIVKVAHKEM